MLRRIYFFSQELEFVGFECAHGCLDLSRLHGQDVKFYHVNERQQRFVGLRDLRDVVEGEGVACVFQYLAARDDVGGEGHGFENFEHHLVRRQEFDAVVQQQVFRHIDKPALAAECGADAKADEQVLNDGGAGGDIVHNESSVGLAATEQ